MVRGSETLEAADWMTAGLPGLTALVLLMSVTAYSVAGGIDFGAGIWDLLAGSGKQAAEARALIDHAMGPVWEANNVWLVFAIVICWTGFPLLFQSVFASLYPLFSLALLGVILRGAFFAFRHIATGPRVERLSSLVFGISSLVTPLFFAASLGAIASGRVAVGEPPSPVLQACISPMSISFGLVSVAATAFSGASFLVGDARRYGIPEMVDYFRHRAVIATLALIAVGTLGLISIAFEAPRLLTAMITASGTPFVLAAVGLTPVVGFLLWRRRFIWYRVLTVGAVGSLVPAWGLAQAPFLLPGSLTISQAAAPTATHVLLLVTTAALVLLVLPSLWLLLYLDQRSTLESPKA
jgi:cytochrome d ubiquinol oxidase subunit II